MSTKQKLIDHLNQLKAAYKEAFESGDWERADYIGLCIDDTRTEIKKAGGAA